MNYLLPDWPAPTHVKAYTTVRSSWGARDSHPKEATSTEQLKALFKLPDNPIWIRQTHSSIAIEATPKQNDIEADASFTLMPNHVCAVLTADCLPILICNRQGTFVAAIHAGWRGLARGVIEATIKHAPLPLNELQIWLGPAIGPSKFEVGADVYDAFTRNHPDSSLAFQPLKPDKWLADLYKLARMRLNILGITSIYGGNFCTYTQEELFYSYRRDQGKTGRMASLIWIQNP
jgi:polyphenol oxidase